MFKFILHFQSSWTFLSNRVYYSRVRRAKRTDLSLRVQCDHWSRVLSFLCASFKVHLHLKFVHLLRIGVWSLLVAEWYITTNGHDFGMEDEQMRLTRGRFFATISNDSFGSLYCALEVRLRFQRYETHFIQTFEYLFCWIHFRWLRITVL